MGTSDLLRGGLFQEKITAFNTLPASKELLGNLVTAHRLPDDQYQKVMQLKDLLDKMLMLDSSRRININQCLMHPFITERL